jgi:hypothetical protein
MIAQFSGNLGGAARIICFIDCFKRNWILSFALRG